MGDIHGHAYMNGDIGKLPQGAVYPGGPESAPGASSAAAAVSVVDYETANGAARRFEGTTEAAAATTGSHVYTESEEDAAAQRSSMAELNLSGLPLEQLKRMLSSQLEYYFSRENLANDTYLLSQMDNDQYVPIWTVANFNQVKKLTADIKLITEVLRESPNVQVDEEGQKVRPNHKRCIVILREIPDSTPLDDVKNLFSGEGCPRLISCEFAHNSSWYVTFESDEDAQKAYRFLREEVREFQGKPIMARIKAKPMNRLPIPSVTGVGGMKNGYRTPPPQPVYDPSAYPPGQQRFLYTNGTAMPQTTMPPYANPVHLYHQPFYPAGIMPWPPASPAYFDMAGVFTVNGITPHNSFKPHNRGFNPRNRNKHRSGPERGGGPVAALEGSGMVHMGRIGHTSKNNSVSIGSMVPTPPPLAACLPTTKPTSSYQAGTGGVGGGTKFHSSHTVVVANESHFPTSHSVAKASSCQDTIEATSSEVTVQPQQVQTVQEPAQQLQPSQQIQQPQQQHHHHQQQPQQQQQFPRHRVHRRTKDQEASTKGNSLSNASASIRDVPSTNVQYNRSIVQFDLEATAFPPLPGLESGDSAKTQAASNEATSAECTQSQNRLSDVVKGTAKLKGTRDKDQQTIGSVGQTSQHHHHHHHHHHPHHTQQLQATSRSSSPGCSGAATNAPKAEQSSSACSTIAAVAPVLASNAIIDTTCTPGTNNPTAGNNHNNNTTDSTDIALSTITLTPPSSPDKSVKTGDTKTTNCADGRAISTKAAEDIEPVTRCDSDVPNEQPRTHAGFALSLQDLTGRPSYAQVAQHTRELHCTKHKADETKDGSE